jgi:hypothetical protein
MAVGRRYAVVATIAAVSSAFKTPAVLTSAATVRPKLYHFILSTLGVAADGVLEWKVQRFTAAGTTTAVTPVALDPADPAALAAGGSNASVEPTYTAGALLFDKGLNQRVTYTWYAPQDGEIVLPATAANGVGIATLSSVAPAYTGVAAAEYHYAE